MNFVNNLLKRICKDYNLNDNKEIKHYIPVLVQTTIQENRAWWKEKKLTLCLTQVINTTLKLTCLLTN